MTHFGKLEVGKVTIMPHATLKARQRIPECRGRDDHSVKTEIERRVREACSSGSVYDSRPKAFRQHGERAARLSPGQRVVVWGDSAFVVDVGLLPTVTVVTVFKKLDRSIRLR